MKKVLIIDDSRDLLTVYETLLKSEGYEIITTTSPAEALKQMESEFTHPDLVLLDCLMPEMSGKDLLAKVSPSQRKKFRVVGMSCLSPDSPQITALRGFLDGFEEKPSELDGILRVVENYLGR